MRDLKVKCVKHCNCFVKKGVLYGIRILIKNLSVSENLHGSTNSFELHLAFFLVKV